MLKSVSRILVSWPFNDLLKSISLVYVLYLSRQKIRINMLRYKALLQNLQAKLEDENKEMGEIKHLMFSEVFSILKNKTEENFDPNKLNIVEIGIGCGNNFKYYPKDVTITGIEVNSLCEKYAWSRLEASNKMNKNNISMKDYLIGFCENMSCVRGNSLDLVISTGSTEEKIEDFDQAINEIYRVLKKDGLFVYLENRHDTKDNILNTGLKTIINNNMLTSSNNNQQNQCFSNTLSKSLFAKEDKILTQRVFNSKVYGIATK